MHERRDHIRGGGRAPSGGTPSRKLMPTKFVIVGEVDVDELVGAVGGDEGDDRFGVLPMRIKKGEAAALRGNLAADVSQQNRLAGAGLAKNDGVPGAGDGVDRDRHV